MWLFKSKAEAPATPPRGSSSRAHESPSAPRTPARNAAAPPLVREEEPFADLKRLLLLRQDTLAPAEAAVLGELCATCFIEYMCFNSCWWQVKDGRILGAGRDRHPPARGPVEYASL